MQLQFIKMNGAGNDFVVLDARKENVRLTEAQIRTLSARDNPDTGGCDQLIILAPSKEADVFMRIYNADGGQVDACGNATRCVVGLLEEELERLPVTIQTNAGLLRGLQKAHTPEGEEYILVDMGAARFDAPAIPLAAGQGEAAALIAERTGLSDPAFVSMGNPHVIFFRRFEPGSHTVRDDTALFDLPLETLGPLLEKMTDVFPQGVNVSFVMLRGAADGLGHIVHARVWERGAGLTKACGTAACAILAAAHARDASIRSIHLWFEPSGMAVTVQLDEQGHILLGGPIETEFTGTLDV